MINIMEIEFKDQMEILERANAESEALGKRQLEMVDQKMIDYWRNTNPSLITNPGGYMDWCLHNGLKSPYSW